MNKAIYDTVIIGGGPAGLTAGIYTSRSKLKTLLIESPSVSGQAVLSDNIENYPGFIDGINGFELIDKFRKHAEKFGLEFMKETVRRIEHDGQDKHKFWKVITEDNTYSSLSLIIATGAGPRKLNIPGEEELTGKGVSYCAVCDGPFFREKNIFVIGGGDTALQEALYLTKFGKKVTLVHRKGRPRAAGILRERASSNKKMEFMLNSVATEISGSERVESIKIRNLKTLEEKNLPCDGIFIFIGLTPNTDFLKNTVRLDEKGYIISDDNMNTSRKGIFACGDSRKKSLRQIITACGDGATAAFSCLNYIEEIKGIEYK